MFKKPIDGVGPASDVRFLSLTITSVSLSKVDRAVQRILLQIAEGRFQRSCGSLDLSRLYELEPPAGGAHLFKVAVYSPRAFPGGSVLVTNLLDGWNSLSYLLAKDHKSFQIQLISTKTEAEFPQNRLEIWDGGQSQRVIMVMRDSDEWIFFQRGKLADFENHELYKNRIKKKRFDRKIIFEYMQRIGFDLLSEGFWSTDEEAVCYEEICKT